MIHIIHNQWLYQTWVRYMARVHSNRLLQNSLTFPWHLPDNIHISLTKRNNKKCKWQVLKIISQNKRPLAKMMMLKKQSKVHNETIWKSPYLRKILSLHIHGDWRVMLSKMVIFPDIMWNSMTFFINFAECQNFPDTLQNSLTIPWPWEILFLPDISLTAMNPDGLF